MQSPSASGRSPEQAIRQLRPGLSFFWFLNGELRTEDLRRQLAAFAKLKPKALVLHPRSGLLMPYLSTEWFELVRLLAGECVKAGIEPWLYDEDYCPSGTAAGRVTMQHPEYLAHGIERFEAPADLKGGQIFFFPSGKLLWAGLLPPEESSGAGETAPRDMTEHVGVMRRHWEVSPWDSRWYYPAMPLYDCPRSESYIPEYAIRKPADVKSGWRLVAFVARTVGIDSPWQNLADSLNPAATEAFLQSTYEPYAKHLGDMLGREVPAMFTDEPKYLSARPFTPGLFESFAQIYGYDLRPRLDHLFTTAQTDESVLTRLHFREWTGKRFVDAWMKPVKQWCHNHGIALVGHVSPEDDPVQQASCVSNLFPVEEQFDLAGLDLIVPAVGDARHAVINVGPLTATSAAQQFGKAGVMSETLGASGEELATDKAARIMAWQVVSGISHLVVHGAFFTTMGLRVFDAGPDFGPDSPRWDGISDAACGLQPFFEVVGGGATQLAPVGIFWPMRSFWADGVMWEPKDIGRRKQLNAVMMACLQSQVGVHFLDEKPLAEGSIENGELRVGRARYRAIVIPSTSVIGAAALERLRELRRAKVPVYSIGDAPAKVQTAKGLDPITDGPWEVVRPANLRQWCREALPRVLPLTNAGDELAEVRASAWQRDGKTTYLAVNIDTQARTLRVGKSTVELKSGEIVALRGEKDSFDVAARFDSNSVTPATSGAPMAAYQEWSVRFGEEPWKVIDRPLAVYQLRPVAKNPGKVIHMVLTGAAAIGEQPIADWLDYRARFSVPSASSSTRLVLEPTAVRGRLTVSLGDRSWKVEVSDIDPKPHEIDLGNVPSGSHELLVRVHDPTPFDGIKSIPAIILANGQGSKR